MGRGVADRGAGVAGRSGGQLIGCWPIRSCDGAVGAVAAGGRRDRPVGVDGWAADDRDGDVCQVDGAQGALPVGVPVVGGGGVGLDSSAAVLPDRVVGAGAGRVDGPQAHPSDRRRDGQRADARVDRRGDALEAVPGAGGADRLDGDRGRREVPDRRGPGGAWCPRARAGGPQAREAGRRAEAAGAGSLAGDGSHAACGHAHDPSALRRGEVRGAAVDRADGEAAGALDQGDPHGSRRSRGRRARGRGREDEAQGGREARGSSRIAARRSPSRSSNGSRASRSPTGSCRWPIRTPGRSARASSASRTSSGTSSSSPR